MYQNEVKEYNKGWTLPKRKCCRRRKNDCISLYENQLTSNEEDYAEYMTPISLVDIRIFAPIHDPYLELCKSTIPTELIKVCINTLTFNATTPEEQALGYFARRKLKKLSN